MTPFEFASYLDLADELAARPDEAAWRSAISRAYYAVLHVAYQALPVTIRATISPTERPTALSGRPTRHRLFQSVARSDTRAYGFGTLALTRTTVPCRPHHQRRRSA